MCAQCGRPWHKHGHSVDDYDPDTGMVRGDTYYADQAETTEQIEAQTRMLLDWARQHNQTLEEKASEKDTTGNGRARDQLGGDARGLPRRRLGLDQ
jgi:hypothetical protein